MTPWPVIILVGLGFAFMALDVFNDRFHQWFRQQTWLSLWRAVKALGRK